MRTLSLPAVLLLAPLSPAAPALGEKPVKYEYAELRYVRTAQIDPAQAGPGRKREAGQGGAGGFPGGAGGQGGAGGAFQPGGQALVTKTTVRWTTGDDEVEAEDWSDLAKKLKVGEPKRQGTPSMYKLRLLNHLSAEGWEQVPSPIMESSGANVWQFRRKVQ
jgi:hypothetical protein